MAKKKSSSGGTRRRAGHQPLRSESGDPLHLPVKSKKGSSRRARELKPPVGPMERLSGSILDPQGLQTIDSAIGLIIPEGMAGHNRYLRAARCPLPEINIFENLLDDAWGVLDGEPSAALHFRRTLDYFAHHRTQVSSEVPVDVGDATRSLRHLDSSKVRILRAAFPNFPASYFPTTPVRPVNTKAGHKASILPATRFLPVLVASLHVAENLEDAERLLRQMRAGLRGSRWMDGLLEAAKETLYDGDSKRLRGMLDYIVGICGPDDGPLPPSPEPRPHPELPEFPGFGFPDSNEFERMVCTWLLDQPIEFLIPPNLERKRYKMTSLSTDHACEGELLIIQGRNFGEGFHGDTPSLVCFATNIFTIRTDRNRDFCCVEAEQWSDTEIRVRVPECAGSGQLSLRIWELGVEVCGNLFSIYMQGDGLDFDGPFLTINLSIDGSRPLFVLPNTDVTIEWFVQPATNVVVELEIIGMTWPSTIIVTGLPAIGSYLLHTASSEHQLTVKLKAQHTLCNSSATNTLEFWVTVPPVISIDGVEVTQGIQTYGRSDVPDNSRSVVANKDTIVRAYVSCDRNGFKDDTAKVTGVLWAQGPEWYQNDLHPCNGYSPLGGSATGFIEARPSDRMEREETDDTLNFKIPASFAVGKLEFFIDVFSFDHPELDTDVRRSHSVAWKTVRPLPVKAIRIKGRANKMPSESEALFTILRAFDLLPSPTTEVRVRKKIYDLKNNVQAWGGYKTDRGLWRTVRLLVGKHNAVEGVGKKRNIWVGLTYDWNRGQMAWPEFSTCVSHRFLKGEAPAGSSWREQGMYEEPYQRSGRIKTAHEIGHCLHMGHVKTYNDPFGFCAFVGCYDHPNGPYLEDVAFDPYYNEVVLVGNRRTADFMSYAPTRWASGDSWVRMRERIGNLWQGFEWWK